MNHKLIWNHGNISKTFMWHEEEGRVRTPFLFPPESRIAWTWPSHVLEFQLCATVLCDKHRGAMQVAGIFLRYIFLYELQRHAILTQSWEMRSGNPEILLCASPSGCLSGDGGRFCFHDSEVSQGKQQKMPGDNREYPVSKSLPKPQQQIWRFYFFFPFLAGQHRCLKDWGSLYLCKGTRHCCRIKELSLKSDNIAARLTWHFYF